jgi:hypothetical protein
LALSRERRDRAPPVADPPPSSEAVVKGIASTVALDYVHGIVHKTYRPGIVVRALYWLAFQAPFPYVSNRDAIAAARERRRIAGLLTKFWYGEDLVAPVVDIHEEEDGRVAFVTRLVAGKAPTDRRDARRYLKGLTRRFVEAGLPTWQVSPYNPRATGNLIALEAGGYRLIDLESNLVAPIEPLSALVGAIRQRNFPSFDDINPLRLESYLKANEAALRAALDGEYFELLDASRAYAAFAARWHGGEPWIVGRIAGVLLRVVDLPTWRRSLQRATADGQRRAQAYLRRGIAQWLGEGRLSGEQAEELGELLHRHELALALTHLGAHMAISVSLRFPFGSVTRFLWTVLLRLSAEWRGLRRKEDVSADRAVHTAPVAFAALVPGFGAGAYLLSKPLVMNRALAAIAFDLMLRKLPFRLHARLRLAAVMNALAGKRHGGTSGGREGVGSIEAKSGVSRDS